MYIMSVERHQKYNKKRRNKTVSFFIESEADLLSFADSIDFSNWVKRKIKQEIKKELEDE